MTRWATDAEEVEAFLWRHVSGAMFPLGNLREHGIDGGPHRRATRFLVTRQDGITGVVGLSTEGALFPVGDPDCAAAAQALAGRSVTAVIGPSGPARALKTALGMAAATTLDDDEVQYDLALDRLIMPATDGLTLHPLETAPRDLLLEWRTAYAGEVLGEDPETAASRAVRDIDGYLAAGSHRVLIRDGKPVAMTGFNAALPGIVQIGGVWTPPGLRGQGLARAAVALHLAEAQAKGATRAVLFAVSAAARRVYEALGFRETGRYSLILFSSPQEVRPCP